jgi:excisionase family DNA binding protein
MENAVLIQNIDTDSLRALIEEAVKNELAKLPGAKESKYLTRQNLADMLHVSLPSVDKLINTGKIKGRRVGGRILIKSDEIYLDEIPISRHRR